MTADKLTNSPASKRVREFILSGLRSGLNGISYIGNPEPDDSPYGPAVKFNGESDAIFIPENPLKNLTSLTIEVLFRPDLNGPEEQRFLHFGETDGDRLLIETRSTKDGKWYLDTFFITGQSKKVLIEPKFAHPVGQWYHVALTINKKGQMTNFVNGKKELSEASEFSPLKTGVMSIGVRQNKISWYKGAIYKVRISREALDIKGFMPF